MNISDKMTKARTSVILDAPFFGALLLRMNMVEDPSIETMCTNGKEIRYNPEFSANLTELELKGVLCHEVMHPALGHLWRLEHRDLKKWNMATDYAINEALTEYAKSAKNKPYELPKGGLLDKKFYGMASEDIYNQLPDDATDGFDNVGGFTEPDDGKGGSDGEDGDEGGESGSMTAAANDSEQLEQEWKAAVMQAALAERSKKNGQLPASLSRLIEELVTPTVDWRQQLMHLVRSIARDDYSFRRPNRRYARGGCVLPSLYSERLGKVAVAVDTSGSVSQEELKVFFSEAQAILDTCQPAEFHMLDCDTKVYQHEIIHPGQPVTQFQPKGGGGTRFEPVFEALEDTHDIAVMIYFTDLYGSFPKDPPAYPVIWVNRGEKGNKAPFGTTIDI